MKSDPMAVLEEVGRGFAASADELERSGRGERIDVAEVLRRRFPESATCPSRTCRDHKWPCRELTAGPRAGWRVHLIPMIYTVRLSVSAPKDGRDDCATEGWCYDVARSTIDAVVAFCTWDGEGDPCGMWIKHTTTGRQGPGSTRRPDDVDD